MYYQRFCVTLKRESIERNALFLRQKPGFPLPKLEKRGVNLLFLFLPFFKLTSHMETLYKCVLCSIFHLAQDQSN